MAIPHTGSQTVGPYFHVGLTFLNRSDLIGDGFAGEKITIRGRIFDGDGNPINDAMIEIWQADSEGNFPKISEEAGTNAGNSNFRGFGRVATDESGAFAFATIKPGRVAGPANSLQAPHISVTIFMRGLLKQLNTRMYFPDESSNRDDALLNAVEPARRGTLILSHVPGDERAYEWNVVMQGSAETVFFAA